MHPELIKLLDLQARDVELLEVNGRLKQLDSEVAELDSQLNKARDAVVAAVELAVGELNVHVL